MAAHMAAASAGGALQYAGARRVHQPCANLESLQNRSVFRKEEPAKLSRCNQGRSPVAAPGRRVGGGKQVRGGGWRDPFDYGSVDDVEYGDVLSEGKQNPEGLGLEHDDESPHGFLDFPAFYNPEIASLGVLVRGDVRKCACFVSGGVYENLLFFPVIQLLKDRYPGVKIDVYATPRGKQTYELNKNVRRAFEYAVDDDFVEPVEFTEMVGKLKNSYYDLILSTRLSGLGHAIFLWLSDCKRNVSYVYPNVNAAFADLFLSTCITAPRLNLSEGGYNMYKEMIEEVGKEGRGVAQELVRPLYINVSRKLQEVIPSKYAEPGTGTRGDYLVFHGIESDSQASMQSKGDTDSLLPLSVWAKIANATRTKVVVVIPHTKEVLRVYEEMGIDANVIFISTPGQLAALIYDSIGVISTNTAAMQLAIALRKPSVALFGSAEKAELFVPPHANNVAVVASKTGKLSGIDINEVISSVSAIADNISAEAFQRVCSVLITSLVSGYYLINSGRPEANGRAQSS